MIDLDDLDLLRKLDPDDMLGRISELPQQCDHAWGYMKKFRLPDDYRDVSRIVVLGMGGSAIGGDLLRSLVANECPVPILVNRDYDLPAFVNEETLVIASSYSGNTEETVTAFAQGKGRGAKLLAITTGGKLARWAQEWNIPHIIFSYKAQPRAALGHSLIPLVGILQKMGLIGDQSDDVKEAVAAMEEWQGEIKQDVPTARNAAKSLAHTLYGHLSVVYGAGHLAAIARRWKTQFNENAKNWGFFEVMPELHHNAVVGFEYPEDLADKIRVVILSASLDHPRVQKRWRLTEEILRKRGVSWERVEARGESALAQVLTTIHFGDYVSCYLAMLNQADPTPVEAIAYLKERLAQKEDPR